MRVTKASSEQTEEDAYAGSASIEMHPMSWDAESAFLAVGAGAHGKALLPRANHRGKRRCGHLACVLWLVVRLYLFLC